MRPITECKDGNCVFHFPQFARLSPDEWRENLLYAIKPDRLSPAKPDHLAIYKMALEIIDRNTQESFIESCELAGELYGLDLYLDLRGGIASFRPCCR